MSGVVPRAYPALHAALLRQLEQVPPSRAGALGYRPCRVELRDGTLIDHVYVQRVDEYLAVWGVRPESDRGKRALDAAQVVRIEEATDRLPARFAEQLYRAGESSMGGCLFTLSFADGSTQAYGTGNAVDFLPYPPGQTPRDVVAVAPHEGGDPARRMRGLRYAWCLYAPAPSA